MATPTTAFAGNKPLRRYTKRFSVVKLASDGFPSTNAAMSNECIQYYIREAVKLDFKPSGDKDTYERTLTHVYEATLTIPSLQHSLAEFLNALKLSTGYVQAFLKATAPGGGSYFYNFVDNAGGCDAVGGTDPATGSIMLGLVPKLTIDDSKSLLDLELKGELWEGEYEWLVDTTNTAAIHTGGTGGTSLGLTAQAESRTKNRGGGLMYFKVGSNKIGIRKKGFKIELMGVDPSSGDHKSRPLCSALHIKGELVAEQLGQDMMAAWYAGSADLSFELKLASGILIQLNGGCVTLTNAAHIGEDESFMKYEFEGEVNYPADWAAPDTIDCGIATATTLTITK